MFKYELWAVGLYIIVGYNHSITECYNLHNIPCENLLITRDVIQLMNKMLYFAPSVHPSVTSIVLTFLKTCSE